MLYAPADSEAVFLERPNRFLGIAEIDGGRERIHVPDPGRLRELLYPRAGEAGGPQPGHRPDLRRVLLERRPFGRKSACAQDSLRRREGSQRRSGGVPGRGLTFQEAWVE